MTIKTLTAVAIVTAALSGPVFAQDANVNPATQKPIHALRHYRGAYNEVQAPAYAVPQVRDNWGPANSFDRSRIGEHDPDFSPAGS